MTTISTQTITIPHAERAMHKKITVTPTIMAFLIGLLITLAVMPQVFLPYIDQKGWPAFGRYFSSVLFTSLTMVWMWRTWPMWHFKKKPPAFVIGKAIGPFAMIGWTLAICWAMIGLTIGLTKGYLTGAIVSLSHDLGWFSRLLDKIGPSATIELLVIFFVGLAFLIGIIIFVESQAGSIIKELFGAVKGIVTGNLQGEAKFSYKLAGTLAVSALINEPAWNNDAYFLPSIISAAVGATILATTLSGQQETRDVEEETYCTHCGAPLNRQDEAVVETTPTSP